MTTQEKWVLYGLMLTWLPFLGWYLLKAEPFLRRLWQKVTELEADIAAHDLSLTTDAAALKELAREHTAHKAMLRQMMKETKKESGIPVTAELPPTQEWPQETKPDPKPADPLPGLRAQLYKLMDSQPSRLEGYKGAVWHLKPGEPVHLYDCKVSMPDLDDIQRAYRIISEAWEGDRQLLTAEAARTGDNLFVDFNCYAIVDMNSVQELKRFLQTCVELTPNFVSGIDTLHSHYQVCMLTWRYGVLDASLKLRHVRKMVVDTYLACVRLAVIVNNHPDLSGKICTACSGNGIIPFATDRTKDLMMPYRHCCVERCDSCGIFPTDLDAAREWSHTAMHEEDTHGQGRVIAMIPSFYSTVNRPF